jgi:oxaloacetate decarboxylase alpha subunit
VERFIVLDPMHDMRAIRRTARMIRAAGGDEVVGALTYTVSEVHNDAYYSGLAAQMARCRDIDRVYIKDPTGLLTPDRARTLISAVRSRLGSIPLELHSHCTLGLSPLTYLAAAELGVRVLHVACGPLASGTSLPDAQRTAANLRELGHRVPIDDRAVALAADYLQRLAAVESRPPGTPREYDAAFLRHQVAGGVMTTMLRQLTELGLADRFDAVMAEVAQVRAELGYPIMVTPFPQIVCSQGVYNVIGRERYATVPDQVIRYVLGTFGRPTGPVDPHVADKILASPGEGADGRAATTRAGRAAGALPRRGRRGIAAPRGHARRRGGRDAGRGASAPPLQPRRRWRARAPRRARLAAWPHPHRRQQTPASGWNCARPRWRRPCP